MPAELQRGPPFGDVTVDNQPPCELLRRDPLLDLVLQELEPPDAIADLLVPACVTEAPGDFRHTRIRGRATKRTGVRLGLKPRVPSYVQGLLV
jgi:hypothetical protein